MRTIFITILLTLCISCTTTKYIPVETIKTEYESKAEYKIDSIYTHDSILIYTKNDTVYVDRYKYLYKYKNRFKTDTVMVTDSILVPVPVKVEVNLLKWYQTLFIWLGVGALMFFIGYFVKRFKLV